MEDRVRPDAALARAAQDRRDRRSKTLLVVGLGGIGTEGAKRAHGIGMRVIATRNSSREGPAPGGSVVTEDLIAALNSWIITRDLRRYVAGEKMSSVVDLEREY